ncbi:class I SAM-dependent methyltransferase [Kineococcus rubinsiae]|uniref:class I SAM-dependent methyltransferase n=1 Tax=Kineococcus rubinsiae TaxID=2609562 RepID=UPI001430BAB0|nr:class I SAM-dependent methyltransferase [Kineococcus rubinsiae]NIZ91456.1 class I SAM-dependent methyltransferase [Kineococcus rubinsiae]
MTPTTWPVVDGIPFQRAGREVLAAAVVDLLDGGDPAGARALLLRDADDWWDEAPPTLAEASAAAGAATLSEATLHLRLGRVGDYLRYRWSDPAFLAGLGLLRRAWPGAGPGGLPVVEVAAGTGVLLRELALRGVQRLTGVDVVHAKLWLARRFVLDDLPADADVDLVVADAAHPWPPALAPQLDAAADRVVVCHDAFYFLPDPPSTAARLRALAGDGGCVVVGAVPNGLLPRVGGGARLSPQDLLDLFPGAELHDDAELAAEVTGGPPAPARTPAELAEAVTVSAVLRAPGWRARPDAPDLGLPVPGRVLRPNPLYSADGELRWPSPRYAADYAERCGYLPPRLPAAADLAADPVTWARRRVLLDLPEHW